MTETHTVESVKLAMQGDRYFWAVARALPGAAQVLHMFPPVTLLWRAVEYGIDPGDSSTLLDIVLHEPFLTAVENHHLDPAYVHNTGPATARQAHLARIEAVKRRAQVTDPHGHLAAIHAAHTIDAEFMAKATDHLVHVRRLAAERSAGRG